VAMGIRRTMELGRIMMGKTTLRFLPVCMGTIGLGRTILLVCVGNRKTIGLARGRTVLPVCVPGIRGTIGLGKNILPVCVGIRKTIELGRTAL